ncbi:hypothetical protein FG152_18110 [Ochrobactrum sp. XJ1]|nr:hypothetical protein [Ochrobactrum sp. XJ1]
MAPLPMTSYERAGRAGKVAAFIGVAGLGSALVYAAAGGVFPRTEPSPAEMTASHPNEIGGGELPHSRVEPLTVKASSEGHRESPMTHVVLPDPEMLRASVKPDRKATLGVDVQRFDLCRPACDTRDPLVAAKQDVAQVPPESAFQPIQAPIPESEPVVSHGRLVRGGREVLGLVTDASGAALNKGKATLRLAMDTIW